MTLTLTNENREKNKDLLLEIKKNRICRISLRQFARIIRNMVAGSSTVTFGPLHYRNLEKDKIGGLKYHNNDLNIIIITLVRR